MVKLLQIPLEKAESWNLNKQWDILRLQRNITLRTSQAVECWASFCLVLISFGVWQTCAIQMHSAEASGTLSQLPSHLGSPHPWIVIWRKYFLVLVSCLWIIGPSPPPPYLSFELWQKSVSQLNLFRPKCRALRLMIVTFKGSKRETTPSKPWGRGSSGFHSLHWQFLYRPSIGKTVPSSNERHGKWLSSASPWAPQDLRDWAELPTVGEKQVCEGKKRKVC